MNIKDAYIHNGEAILKDIQVSGSKLQKLKAGKDANDAYLTWVDVLDFSSFGASGHNHDDLYLKLTGGTMSGDITFPYEKGLIYNLPTLSSYARSMLVLKAKKTTSDANVSNVFAVGYRVAADGYKYTYIGGGNYDSTDNLRFNADNSITIGTNVVYHAGNLNIGTLMGSTAIGDSDEPVYWNGSTFTKCGPFASSTHDHDDRYLKLAGNGTTNPMTGTIYVKDKNVIYLHSTNKDLEIWRVSGNNTSNFDGSFGFYLKYNGTGEGDNNTLSLWANNQNGTDKEAYRIQQSGIVKFLQTPNVNGTNVSLEGHSHSLANLTGTLDDIADGTTRKLSNYVTLATDQEISGVKTFAAGKWKLKANESNETVSKTWDNSTYYKTDDSALVTSLSGIKNAIRFRWYNDYYDIGVIRAGSQDSYGFGIGKENSDNTHVLDLLRVTTTGTYIIGNLAYHAGNLTIKTLMGTTAIGDADEPVYWSGTAFVKAGAYPTKSSWNYDDVYLKLTGGILTGDLTLKANSGDSPKIIFQRGTLADSLDDWRIFDTGGSLKFQHTTGSTTDWKDFIIFSATAGTLTINGNTALHSGNYTTYTVKKDGTGATGTWGIDISGNATTATTATNSDKVDEHHAMSAGSLLYKYAVTATIPASSVSGDFWYATITFARSYVRELTRSMLDATYSNRQGQVYLNTYEYNGAWYAFTTNYNGSNIKGIAHKSQNNPIYYVKLAKPTTYNNAVPDGTITVYSPYNCTITVSATAPSGVTFTDLITPGFTNLKANSASSADSAATATYASNVGTSADHVTAAQVKALHTWYTTVAGNNASGVIDNWNEIKNFIDGFHETDDLATYLTNTFLAKSGGTMTGQIKWTDSTALPEQTSPQYFLCIDAFNSGGTTKWASKANTLKALTGLTSTAIGDSDEPVYWDGSKFVKAGAYPTKASWNYDDTYPKKYSYSLPPQKCVKITYDSQAPVIISAGRSNGNSEFLLAGLGYGADGWTRNQFRCLIPSASFTWKLSATSCTVELYHNNTNSGNAVVTVITTGSITFTAADALSGDADTKRFACFDELTWDNISGKPATATGYGYIGTTAVQGSSAAQDLTGIKDATFSGVLNITGRQSYAEGIRIHDYSGISSIWFRAVNADNYDAGMIGITADSTGLRFRLPASATGTSVADKVKIAYGGNVSVTNALTVSGAFTASAAVYFTGLGSGSSDVTDDTELLTSYAGTSGFANTTGAGQVYRRQATKLYNYIKSKTDSLYVTSVDVTDDTTNHANQLRYVKGGSSTYFTVPFATNADTVDTYHAERLLHGAYNSSVVYDVLEIKQSNTPIEILIKTKLPFRNGNEMPSIYIRGFAYGNSVPVDIHLVFYIYNGAFCNCSATCYGVWKPQIFLFTYVENETTYVGIGLKKSIYYPRLYVDLADIWGNNGSRYHAGWTYEVNTNSETTIIPEDNKKELEYKALDTSILGSAGSVAWTAITGKPDTFPVEDIYLKLAGGTMTGAAPINFTHDKIAINFRPDSSSYYSKVQYMTAGNEALVFSNVNAVTSFIFKCGYNLVNGSNWNSVFNATTNIPSVQIKKQSLYINAFINTNVNPDYNFYVGGTAAFTGQITSTVAVGTKPFVITSTTLIDNLNADLLDGFHASDFRNNIVDLRSSPQTFNPTYLKDIVFISEADYSTLVSNGSITKNSITHTYNASNWYVIEDKVPEYAENAGNADYASNAGYAGTANWANNVEWDDINNKPTWANSSLSWSDVTGKPTWVTWSETSSNATYSLSNATWTQTITLPTAAGSYILKLVSGNSTLTGVFSIGASDNAKDEISLHLHGNGPRLYARTNGTKLELSRNIATATNTSVTITYRRMI